MEMPKARHAGDFLGGGRAIEAFSFDSEDITFRWDPDVPPHGGLRTTTPGGARVELRPTVAIRPTFLGKQFRHAWSVVVNSVELYQNIWSDEQIPEPGTAHRREGGHRRVRRPRPALRPRGEGGERPLCRGHDPELTPRVAPRTVLRGVSALTER